MYPQDWPSCCFCDQPRLDGHLTCDSPQCDESIAREQLFAEQADRDMAEMQAMYDNAAYWENHD